MQPIRIHIPKDLFEPAAIRHYEADVAPFELKRGIDAFTFEEPLHWSADITNTGGALLVTGEVTGRAHGQCARCLEDASFEVTGDLEGYFILPNAMAEAEDLEEDEFEMLPDDETIDMAPLISSALLVELPIVLLCNPDCKGLCPQCGTNLNEESCSCTPDTTVKESPFAALKDYHFN